MKIFAIADLHLSFNENIDKPMDKFGPGWENHAERLKENWEKLVTDRTRIVVGGPCFADMRARLLRAGADEARMSVQTDYAALVRDIAAAREPVTVIANCSTIEALRLELVKRYRPIDYWAE